VGVPLQIAEHNREPVSVRESREFLLDDPGQFPVRVGRGRDGIKVFRRHGRVSCGCRAEFQGGIHGDAMEPSADASSADRPGSAGEDQEGGLESVFGVGLRAEHPSAGGPDGIGVTADEQLEGGGVLIMGELAEEIDIGDMVPCRSGSSEQAKESVRHGAFRVGMATPSSILILKAPQVIHRNSENLGSG
jgi:hypothetical protein